MSAPDKEPQPLGSTSGKRGCIRICVRCGRELRGVGSHTKYCPDCRAEVNRVRTRERSRRRYAAERAQRAALHRPQRPRHGRPGGRRRLDLRAVCGQAKIKRPRPMNWIGQGQKTGSLLALYYTRRKAKMQDKKAKIRASFDPSTGELLAEASGSEFSLQYLLGVLVAQLAQSHARLTDSTVPEALAKIIAGIVLVANKATPSNATKIDLSRAYKED